MKKILLSLSMLALVGVIAAGATTAFFTDTETSTGNTFTAGSIDLKIDSTAHYNGMICVANNGDGYSWQYEGEAPATTDPYQYPAEGAVCDNSWTETDLGGQKFFEYSDLKPGDYGENTISLHVYDNDAWGRFSLIYVVNSENGCTEPELELDSNCDSNGVGQLDDAMTSEVWLDQGETPGFQNVDANGVVIDAGSGALVDPTEGDNIWQKDGTEPAVDVTAKPVYDNNDNIIGSSYDLWDVLSQAYTDYGCTSASVDGHNGYGRCQGLAADGRMVGSTTYYFGLGWTLPAETGNEVQSDELVGDFNFEVVQRRNNPIDSVTGSPTF